jgi:hypothetical protein
VDLEDHAGLRDLLCEIGRQGPLSRDAHLRLVAERCGWRSSHFKKVVRGLAQSAGAASVGSRSRLA